jgi:hypothetical protein
MSRKDDDVSESVGTTVLAAIGVLTYFDPLLALSLFMAWLGASVACDILLSRLSRFMGGVARKASS